MKIQIKSELQMGTHFKKSIFDEPIQVGLLGWALKAKMKRGLKAATDAGTSTEGSTVRLQMSAINQKETTHLNWEHNYNQL